jgi:hypothetical protein
MKHAILGFIVLLGLMSVLSWSGCDDNSVHNSNVHVDREMGY